MSVRKARQVTPAARRLGAVEARRMLRHPAYPMAMLYIVAFGTAMVVNDEGAPANQAYLIVMLSVLLVYAPATIVVANRVAAATFRSRVREPLDAVPVDERQRTVGAILGVLRGPVLVGCAAAALLLVLDGYATPYTAVRNDAVYPRTAWEYLQLPALVLGAGLLGIAVARWLPWPGVLPLTVLVVGFGTIAMYPVTVADSVHASAWYALWPAWFALDVGMLPRKPLDQEMWHLAYLLGLGALAGVASLLHTRGPRRTLCIAVAVAVLVTAAAGWLQTR
ncbi:hypothetical protein [Jidongwangia harbinensis]|uniref:hypothetical protein n=1 Tax=Jidongwangia harbinensis TaxID=2878561 RepID=UPI001CD99250|nr:hypothetical protein [Jidongwangia harbinensis]MCA2216276.1 hypothetical protein [Jidongwangia harbinensis]MCA2217011.1 hypothetical protein [Jidongwangia harbinensis]